MGKDYGITDALRGLFEEMNGEAPNGESIAEILYRATEDFEFGNISLTVTPATDSDDLFDKQASDLQESIRVGENAITGTLKYVTGYQAYSGDEQNGNFLALKAVANKDGCAIAAELVGGVHGLVHLESDGLIIFRVTSQTQLVRFVVTKDGRSKTFDFALSDIVLGVPAPQTATLTYAMGAYADGGSVPSPVTEAVGTKVNIDFSTHPTREGYNFDGWATADGAASADFSEDGTITITLEGNVTLYPVFAEVVSNTVTLTYSLGEYGSGSVPAAQTAEKNPMGMAEILVTYSPEPTCTKEGNWSFVGWAYTDNANSAAFYKGMGMMISIASDTTLYPVFIEVESYYITIDNADAVGTITVYTSKGATVFTVNGAEVESFSFNTSTNYEIKSASSGPDEVAVFSGTYKGVEYNSVALTVSQNMAGSGYNIAPPDDPTDTDEYWLFQSGDNGTLKLSYHGA